MLRMKCSIFGEYLDINIASELGCLDALSEVCALVASSNFIELLLSLLL